MKQLKIFFLTALLSLTLVSCGNSNNQDGATGTTAPSENVGDKAKDVGDDITNGVEDAARDTADTAEEVTDDIAQ